jgi:hypothetical protein
LPPDIDDFTVVYDDVAGTYTVTYPDKYELLPPGDPTPDEFIEGFAAFRQGESTNNCAFVTSGDPGPVPGTTQIVFENAKNVPGERIELILGYDCAWDERYD